MIIKVLVENTTDIDGFKVEDGLSLYIESGGKKIIFDTGVSDLFLTNALKLGVDIEEIDYLIISHGHYDHGGGLKYFLDRNEKASIYLSQYAFNNYYAIREGNSLEYVGIDKNLRDNERIILIEDKLKLYEGAEIYSGVPHKEKLPNSNKNLYEEIDGDIKPDRFRHEQNLYIDENGKKVLISGCSHNGIMNILSYHNDLYGFNPDFVLGGFHLSMKGRFMESDEYMEHISSVLLSTKAKFYTGHCTGLEAFSKLKNIMGDEIDYMYTGKEIIL